MIGAVSQEGAESMQLQNRLITPLLLCLLLCGCSKGSNDTYTIEVIDGVRYIHNHASLWGDEPKVELEFVQKIGELEGKDENYQLFMPFDLIRDTEGNIYILEMGNSRIQKFNSEGTFIKTISGRGQGPGEIGRAMYFARNADNNLYVSDTGNQRFQVFSPDGDDLGNYRMSQPVSGLDILTTGELVVQIWTSGLSKFLLNIIRLDGSIISEFGQPIQDDDPLKIRLKNTFAFVTDKEDNIYTAFRISNRIEKYSYEGTLQYRADRPLNYEVTIKPTMKTINLGGQSRVVPIYNQVSIDISVDGKGRIWVLSYQYQPNSNQQSSEPGDQLELHIFDSDGTFLGVLPVEGYLPLMKIFDDRLYLIDVGQEMCVKEYRIVEK